jgi:DNA processing protein
VARKVLKSNHYRALETFLDNIDLAIGIGEEVVSNALKQDCAVMHYWQEEYPSSLKTTGSDAPIVIYLRGNIRLLEAESTAAVIGTRNNTKIGEIITERLTTYLSEKGVCIVSGLALGIDSIAHEATLKSNGKTIAVLVDVLNVHPKKNTDLANEILKNDGLLISENPPGINIHPSMFVKRDRIQSALSNVIIPVETSAKGGTLHAVRNGIKYRKEIYAPNPHSGAYKDLSIPQLEGVIALISDGEAIPFTKSDYEELAEKSKKIHEFGPKSLFD